MAMINFVGYAVVPTGKSPDHVVLGDVDLPAGMLPPKPGLTLLYGFRTSRQFISRRILQAEERRQKIYLINLLVDVGEVPPGQMNANDLPRARFMHLGRISRDIGTDVSRLWVHLLPKGLSAEQAEKLFIHANGQITISRPDLIGGLREAPQYQHLDAIGYKLAGTEPLQTVVTLFSMKHVVSVECETDPSVKVVLPQIGED